MDLKELIIILEDIKKRGFIKTLRKGSTGIGYTFESLFGLSETNIPIPDIGGRVEIKTTRKDSKSLVTLFTFNRGVWIKSQRNTIEQYGYIDGDDRYALKSTVFYNKPNSLGFFLEIDEHRNVVNLKHSSGDIIASWDLYEVVGKFYSKLSRLLMVLADRIISDSGEEFHYNEAYLLTDPQTRNFLDGFRNSVIGIDLRMHLKKSGTVRNRGTGFRIKEVDMISLYANRKRLI